MSIRHLTGLQKLCKMYGKVWFEGVTWIWDYHTDEPKLESEMSREDLALSDKAKWSKLKKYLKK